MFEREEERSMYFHGYRVRVTKGDQAKNFTPGDPYRVLAMEHDKPAGTLVLLKDDKGDLRWIDIGEVKVYSIDVPR
jgi:hypothetical protein